MWNTQPYSLDGTRFALLDISPEIFAPGRPQTAFFPRTQRLDTVPCRAPHGGRSAPHDGAGGERTEKRLAFNHCVLGRVRGEAKSVRLVRRDMRGSSRPKKTARSTLLRLLFRKTRGQSACSDESAEDRSVDFRL